MILTTLQSTLEAPYQVYQRILDGHVSTDSTTHAPNNEAFTTLTAPNIEEFTTQFLAHVKPPYDYTYILYWSQPPTQLDDGTITAKFHIGIPITPIKGKELLREQKK